VRVRIHGVGCSCECDLYLCRVRLCAVAILSRVQCARVYKVLRPACEIATPRPSIPKAEQDSSLYQQQHEQADSRVRGDSSQGQGLRKQE